MRSIDGRQFGHVDLLGFVVGVLVDAAAFLAEVGKGWRLKGYDTLLLHSGFSKSRLPMNMNYRVLIII